MGEPRDFTDPIGESNRIAYLEGLKEFFLAGLSFREALRSATQVDKKDFCRFLLHLLPLLYQKALALPQTNSEVGLPETEDTDEVYLPEFVTEEEYTLIENTLERLFGNDDYFLEAHGEEMKFTDAPITSRLSEYLSDIYQPVSNLLLTAKNRDYIALPYAVLRCRKHFTEHWGDCLLASMRVLHTILFNPAQGDEASEEELPSPQEMESKPIELCIQDRINAFMEGLDDED